MKKVFILFLCFAGVLMLTACNKATGDGAGAGQEVETKVEEDQGNTPDMPAGAAQHQEAYSELIGDWGVFVMHKDAAAPHQLYQYTFLENGQAIYYSYELNYYSHNESIKFSSAFVAKGTYSIEDEHITGTMQYLDSETTFDMNFSYSMDDGQLNLSNGRLAYAKDNWEEIREEFLESVTLDIMQEKYSDYCIRLDW